MHEREEIKSEVKFIGNAFNSFESIKVKTNDSNK